MTSQVHDRVRYRRLKYDLVGVKGDGLFDPDHFGLVLGPGHSGCWRAYIATYKVTNGLLKMEKLDFHPGFDENYEPLTDFPTIYGGQAKQVGNGPEYHYPPDTVPYTGGLLIGRGFIDELYVHMGFQGAWKFRQVHELVFDQGRLTEHRDLTAAMEEYRRKLENRELKPWDFSGGGSDMMEWIRSTFRLDYFTDSEKDGS